MRLPLTSNVGRHWNVHRNLTIRAKLHQLPAYSARSGVLEYIITGALRIQAKASPHHAKREPDRAKHEEDERGLKARDYILDYETHPY